jgi:hypothetical protein
MRHWIILLVAAGCVFGQGGGRGGPPPSGKAAAPFDLSGYWVSIITEDWRYRMVTPSPGDYQSVPMTAEARRVADMWDPAKDEAAGDQCKSYGAAAIWRVPARVHFTWQDDQTLRADVDAGTQTRLFHFGNWKPAAGEAATWQGDSVAQWEGAGRGGRGGGRGQPRGGLKVTTTHMRAGYLRKNGVPYSEDAVLTEYYDLARQRNGDQWLVVTIMVEDPQYLTQTFVISSQFKKQADSSGWDPTPCSSRW